MKGRHSETVLKHFKSYQKSQNSVGIKEILNKIVNSSQSQVSVPPRLHRAIWASSAHRYILQKLNQPDDSQMFVDMKPISVTLLSEASHSNNNNNNMFYLCLSSSSSLLTPDPSVIVLALSFRNKPIRAEHCISIRLHLCCELLVVLLLWLKLFKPRLLIGPHPSRLRDFKESNLGFNKSRPAASYSKF